MHWKIVNRAQHWSGQDRHVAEPLLGTGYKGEWSIGTTYHATRFKDDNAELPFTLYFNKTPLNVYASIKAAKTAAEEASRALGHK